MSGREKFSIASVTQAENMKHKLTPEGQTVQLLSIVSTAEFPLEWFSQ
jgi:hypothetical protein